jgi:uncharacterized protein
MTKKSPGTAVERGWIKCYSGGRIHPLNPRPEDIHIEDIAHALSLNSRFTGHTPYPYSVAQHSLIISTLVPREFALWGLLHDASEAYLSDIARPVKHQPEFEFYRVVEKRLMRAVCERFGLPEEEPEVVKYWDQRLLVSEQLLLMGGTKDPESVFPASPVCSEVEVLIFERPWREVKQEFLHVFRSLTR